MSPLNIVTITVINSGLFLAVCEMYRYDSFREKFKMKLITVGITVFCIEMIVLAKEFLDVTYKT